MAPVVPAGDTRVLLGTSRMPPLIAIRVLSEANFQLAKHCVNAHGDLLEACKELLYVPDVMINAPQATIGKIRRAAEETARAAIAKAETP